MRDHGEYGVEAQVSRNEEFLIGRRFHTRALAEQWATLERAAMMEKNGTERMRARLQLRAPRDEVRWSAIHRSLTIPKSCRRRRRRNPIETDAARPTIRRATATQASCDRCIRGSWPNRRRVRNLTTGRTPYSGPWRPAALARRHASRAFQVRQHSPHAVDGLLRFAARVMRRSKLGVNDGQFRWQRGQCAIECYRIARSTVGGRREASTCASPSSEASEKWPIFEDSRIANRLYQALIFCGHWNPVLCEFRPRSAILGVTGAGGYKRSSRDRRICATFCTLCCECAANSRTGRSCRRLQ